jgi:hypothetical protein
MHTRKNGGHLLAPVGYFRLPISDSIRSGCLTALSLPGALLLPFVLGDLRSIDSGFFVAAVLLNWFFYHPTSVRRVLETPQENHGKPTYFCPSG